MGTRAKHCSGYDRLVAAIVEEVSHTGDVNETTLGTLTIPADSMGAYGFVRIFASFYATGKGGNHIFRVKFGGTQIKYSLYATATDKVDIAPAFVWNTNVTNAQETGVAGDAVVHYRQELPVTPAVDTTADVDVTFTGQNSVAGHTIFLKFAMIEVFRFDA
jgi:hypothetical protein